jgi:hypothetical protein
MHLDRACRVARVLNEFELNEILAAVHRQSQGTARRGDNLFFSEDTQAKVQQAVVAGTAAIRLIASEVLEAMKQSVLIRTAGTLQAPDLSRRAPASLSK